MTKLFAILAVLSFAFITTSQPNLALAKKHHPTATAKAEYVCPACGAVSGKPGTCPGDHAKLIKVGEYYSKSDPSYVSSKPGKGPDGNKLVRMTLTKHNAMHSTHTM